MHRRRFLAATASVGLGGCLRRGRGQGPEDPTAEPEPLRIETVSMGLTVPWGAAFHPATGELYVTERPGRIRRLTDEPELLRDLTGVVTARGEGGLLGLAFHPTDPGIAYTYQTYEAGDGLRNRVVEHDVARDFARDRVLVDGIPGARAHDGGRLLASAEGACLYVTCGDAADAASAQNPKVLGGTVLRVTFHGDPHPSNPFDNEVFTYGHRNPQGLALRDGRLYSTETGPDTDDEINVLEAGNNYGWPEVIGESDGEYTDPITTYTPTIAPGSVTFYDGPIADWAGDLFFGALAGEHLHRVRLDGDEVVEQERLFAGDLGRIRTVFTGPEDHLYMTTSNQDGYGSPAATDDRVLRVLPP